MLTNKYLLPTLIISGILAFMSIAYFYFFFLPKSEIYQSTKLEQINEEVRNSDKSVYTNENDDRLEDIENMIREQERDRSIQNDCESTGGAYQGNGICIYE